MSYTCMLLNTVDCEHSLFCCEIRLDRECDRRVVSVDRAHLFSLSFQSDLTAKERLLAVYKHNEKVGETR